ncbi:PIN domain-containing protein [Ensifer aridi]|uniref:PIN domain-containing protein n=1 Tax=Ensifer aridi TaxID=1708715 RepID=UPI0004104BB5|nr:PIN domain-containing protein [Ensifer aridi]
MASKPLVAVLDACVLYPFHLRNVLVQTAFDGLFDARWSDDIHAEWIRNLAANAPGVTVDRLQVTRDRMKQVLREADVRGYQSLIPELELPDPDDRHVLAAAIAGKAALIVSWNVKDFPAQSLGPYGVGCMTPDAFLSELHRRFPDALIDSVARARRNLRRSLPSTGDFLDALERQGLTAFVSVLRERWMIDRA